MPHTFTRADLYDLVWNEPVTKLAERFQISDTGFSKACRKLDVPRPLRGYWARLAAGKTSPKTPLPPRGPGMDETVTIGAGREYGYGQISDEEILNDTPVPPGYDEDLNVVQSLVRKQVGKVRVIPTSEKVHDVLKKLLDADKDRLRRSKERGHIFSWDKPYFEDEVEQRRLDLLNSIALGLERVGMTIRFGTKDGRELTAVINDTPAYFELDTTSQNRKSEWRPAVETRGESKRLRLDIFSDGFSSTVSKKWEDAGRGKLEHRLSDIVVELIVSGERRHREHAQDHYEWRVKRKQNLIERLRHEKEEAERKERERLAAIEKARVDRLLEDAFKYRRAEDIRAYVASIESDIASGRYSVSGAQFEEWQEWALRQADRLDPVTSGSVLASMKIGSDE